ncbi:MAG TPA: flagellar basal body L-ring protein FlgH [Candidatus Binatia bacterium]|jgi:flagellar L-ring protein precursor FlgH|nr:flagellar basal body L-ring protein FlgH [Candidatus Binatia bacterium]
MRLLVLALVTMLAGCYANRPYLEPLPPRLGPKASQPANGSLWHPELAANYAFLDVRAHFPGDLLTVLISENSKGKKAATTDGSAESSIAASVDNFFGLPAAAVKLLPSGFNPEMIVTAETSRENKQDAATTREGNLTASITVRVVDVDTTGNLRVQGDKIVTINSEDQHIVLTGIVRPEDIAPDNSVLSARLADARISYYGYGTVGDKQGEPLAQRLFDWVWPF